ncbi:MAG: DNA translocase FtsK [Verrucomicrobia bacterium]|nr:DNA translocase FtsK [Verrucomicrobiota bacterium]
MATKERTEESSKDRIWVDSQGLFLILVAVVLAAALISYDRLDLGVNTTEPNTAIRNWMGRFGAHVVYNLHLVLGFGIWVLPVLLLGFGFASFIPSLNYLRRWRSLIASVGLVIACVGVLDLCERWIPGIQIRKNSGPSPGGILGHQINNAWVEYSVGRMGAVVTYVMVYLASLLFLTDYQLLVWIRQLWVRVPKTPEEKMAAEEASIEKKAKALEKKARELTQQVTAESETASVVAKPARGKAAVVPQPEGAPEPSGVGADLKPFPEVTIRDLSVPQPREVRTVQAGEVIKADEISAVLTPAVDDPALAAEPRKPKSVAERVLGRPPGAELNDEEGSTVESVESVGPRAEQTDGTDAEDAPPWDRPEDAAHPVAEALPVFAARPRVVMQPRKSKPITVASAPIIGNYRLPSIDLLSLPDTSVKPTETKEELMANARLMVQTLAQFGIEVAPGDITKGPTITRYELHPAPGVKLEKIAGLTNNIAAAMKAERLNILAPIPGKSSVGVEVPNAIKTKVIMRDLLESPEWQNTKARIPLALGKDVYGHPIIADLAEMPHVMIAGSTGSGKSVCINTIIASLVYRFSPDQLRFVMIDPKVVELQQYNALPHLVVPVVTDPKKVILALRWVVNEMEKRYQIFARVGVRNIKSFNERPKEKPLPPKDPELPLTTRKERVEPGADGFAVQIDEQIVVPRDEDIVIPEKLSYIVVIIDELADLMLVAPADVEMAIARITQMARAAGIHCIVATQRPSVDVITGVIKANIPARIAFQVAAKVDSRTILDQMGADKLLGKGDMLYLPPGSGRLIRAQGALITDAEIEAVMSHISVQGKPSYEPEIHQALQKAQSSLGSMTLDPDDEGSSEDDELLQKCIEVIRTEKKASVSLLQRRLKLGYGRAARMMDELEDRGVVGPGKGAEPRDILIDLDGSGFDGGGQRLV